MSSHSRNKNNLKDHAGVALAAPPSSLKSDDPLRFWTNHPTQNILVDLRPFADGEFERRHPYMGGNWGGPYSGRPILIAEIAPALEARCALLRQKSVESYLFALRTWWRLFDAMEAAPPRDGQSIARVVSLADINQLHDVAARRRGIKPNEFRFFLSVANDARKLLRLPMLMWVPPKAADPQRHLITDDQAREIKTALKQDWERVRKTWARNDAIRAEAERRSTGEKPTVLDETGEHLLKNWQYFNSIQKEIGQTLPSGEQLIGQLRNATSLWRSGLERKLMRSIQFPTAEEADTAFHLALLNSGWNPSTLGNLDATAPFLIADHPKDDRQLVLTARDDEDEEITIQSDKPRARGKTQFCSGLKKHSSSPPIIVASYLKRVAPLREILEQQYHVAHSELIRLEAAGATVETIGPQMKLVQELLVGCRSVWLYVDLKGKINWLNWRQWGRYAKPEGRKGADSYLEQIRRRLNAERVKLGLEVIPTVSPSDFRDIYARWVYVQSGGNVLAVMLALGHATLSSTRHYVENNLFNAENDAHARRFMIHLFSELQRGRVDLTILAQLVRHGPLTPEMETRLAKYRQLMRSRIGVGCAAPRHPPTHIAPAHVVGRLCSTQRCLKDCPHARFLPESLIGIAMRVEELLAMSEYLPRESWLKGEFQKELDEGETLLATLFPKETVADVRDSWRERIAAGDHLIPGLGRVAKLVKAT